MTDTEVHPTATKTYVVVYELPNLPKYTGGSTRVAVTEGYSTFEDIRNMIAIKRGVKVTDIEVTSLALLVD